MKTRFSPQMADRAMGELFACDLPDCQFTLSTKYRGLIEPELCMSKSKKSKYPAKAVILQIYVFKIQCKSIQSIRNINL